MVGIYCAVKGCFTHYTSTVPKHRFPNPRKNKPLFDKWVEFCNNEKLLEEGLTPEKIYNNFRVCHNHFSDDDFTGSKRVKPGVCPHLTICKQVDVQDNNRTDSLNVEESVLCTDNQSQQSTEPSTSSCSQQSGRSLADVNVSRVRNLCLRCRHLKKKARYFQKRASACTISKALCKSRLFEGKKVGRAGMIDKVVSNLDEIKARFIKMQLENANKSPHGRRYTLEDKILALAVFKQSGCSYKFLSKIFYLPSKKVLWRLLNRIPIQPGLCESTFDVLKAETKTIQDPLYKYCALLFDEMAIKPGFYWDTSSGSVVGFEDFGYKTTEQIADHVQVFMLRNIKYGWKQPVYYNFVEGATKSPDIVHILKMVIKKTRQAGLHVVAVVCDQGRNNVAAINSLINDTKATLLREGRPFNDHFFFIEGNKVIPIFDPPHLIKGLRNNLMNYNLKYTMAGQQYTAKWEHIVKAYKMDPYMGSLRTMPKLTEQHVNPTNTGKMKVSFCTQVFSRTVACSINLMAFSGTEVDTCEGRLKMGKDGQETAKFIEFADRLFDSLNGGSRKLNRLKPLKNAVTDNSEHLSFWQDAIFILDSVTFLKSDSTSFVPPTVHNFIRTLKNFRELFYLMKSEGFEYLLPRMFNQDPLENFFGMIRQRGSRYNHPTCPSFTSFYKSLLVNGLTSDRSKGANCENDNSEIFITLQRFVTQGLPEGSPEETQRIQVPALNLHLGLIEEQALRYVCGYLLKMAQTTFKHCRCAKYILEEAQESEGSSCGNMFTKLKQYKHSKLKFISNFFLSEMTKALNIVKYVLHKHLHKKHIFKILYNTLRNEINFTNCEHNNVLKKTILTYFLKTEGHNYIKQLNRILNGQDRRKLPFNCPAIFKTCKIKFTRHQRARH